MSMQRLTTLAILCGLVLGVSLPAQQSPSTRSNVTPGERLPADAEILAIIKQRVDDKRSAGIVVGVIDADGRQRIVSYGDPGLGQPPLDGNSVFEIGSISKVFTSTVLADLVVEGEVRLGEPAETYLPP